MGCSASRADGLEHEEALQHVIQMMRELKVKQIANIAARSRRRRPGRRHQFSPGGRRDRRALAGALRLDPRREFQSSAHVGPAIAIARDVVLRDLYVLPTVGQQGTLRRGPPGRDLWTKLKQH